MSSPDLGKRSPGTPLSQAELQQRRDAAKARWEKASGAAAGVVALGAGAAGADQLIRRAEERAARRKAVQQAAAPVAAARGEVLDASTAQVSALGRLRRAKQAVGETMAMPDDWNRGKFYPEQAIARVPTRDHPTEEAVTQLYRADQRRLALARAQGEAPGSHAPHYPFGHPAHAAGHEADSWRSASRHLSGSGAHQAAPPKPPAPLAMPHRLNPDLPFAPEDPAKLAARDAARADATAAGPKLEAARTRLAVANEAAERALRDRPPVATRGLLGALQDSAGRLREVGARRISGRAAAATVAGLGAIAGGAYAVKQLQKFWGSSRALPAPGQGASWDEGTNTWSDRRRGYGTPMQRSWLPSSGRYAAPKPTATINADGSGTTMQAQNSPGFSNWQKDEKKRRRQAQWAPLFNTATSGIGSSAWGGFRSGMSTGGSLARAIGAEDLRKAAAAAVAAFDESKVKRAPDGRFTGNSTLQPRQRGPYYGQFHSTGPSGPREAPGMGHNSNRSKGLVGSIYARRAPEIADEVMDPGVGAKSMYARTPKVTPRMPAGMDEGKAKELLRFAGKRTAERADQLREKVKAGELNHLVRGSRPLDPATVNQALKHARMLALHDIGVIDYRFEIKPEHHAELKRAIPLMWHARRSMANILRQERPGEYAEWRKQFGTAFDDGRTYAKDTRGAKAGEEKKRFYRHQVLVKNWVGTIARQGMGAGRGAVSFGRTAGNVLAAPFRATRSLMQAPRRNAIGNFRAGLMQGRPQRQIAVANAERSAAASFRPPATASFADGLAGMGRASQQAGISERARQFRAASALGRQRLNAQRGMRQSAAIYGGAGVATGAGMLGYEQYRERRAERRRMQRVGLAKAEQSHRDDPLQIYAGNAGAAAGGLMAIRHSKRAANWAEKHSRKRVQGVAALSLKRAGVANALDAANPVRVAGSGGGFGYKVARTQARAIGNVAGMAAGGAVRAGAGILGGIAGDLTADTAANNLRQRMTGEQRTGDRRQVSVAGVALGALAGSAAQGVIEGRRRFRYRPRTRMGLGVVAGALAGGTAEWLGNKSAEKTHAALTKRSAGQPLSEAELQQRRDAAKARWAKEEALDERRNERIGAGAVLGAAVAVPSAIREGVATSSLTRKVIQDKAAELSPRVGRAVSTVTGAAMGAQKLALPAVAGALAGAATRFAEKNEEGDVDWKKAGMAGVATAGAVLLGRPVARHLMHEGMRGAIRIGAGSGVEHVKTRPPLPWTTPTTMRDLAAHGRDLITRPTREGAAPTRKELRRQFLRDSMAGRERMIAVDHDGKVLLNQKGGAVSVGGASMAAKLHAAHDAGRLKQVMHNHPGASSPSPPDANFAGSLPGVQQRVYGFGADKGGKTFRAQVTRFDGNLPSKPNGAPDMLPQHEGWMAEAKRVGGKYRRFEVAKPV